MADTDFIADAYRAFEAAPVVYIAWTIIVAGFVGTLAWFVRKSVDAGTIEAMNQRLEGRREDAERAQRLKGDVEAELAKVTKDLARIRSAGTPVPAQALEAIESHTASATTSLAGMGKIFIAPEDRNWKTFEATLIDMKRLLAENRKKSPGSDNG